MRLSQHFTFLKHYVFSNLRKQSFYVSLGFVAILFFIFYTNTLHEEYPDEFDNILGGFYILKGIFPFSGFFSHHGPVAYFVAAIIALFSNGSFVTFRIVYSIALALFFLWSYWYLRVRVSATQSRFYLISVLIFGLSATYFWLHMLLADSLASVLIMPVVAILLLRSMQGKQFIRSDLVIISALTFLMIFTSLTHVYVGIVVYVYTLYYYFFHKRRGMLGKESLFLIAIFAVPYLLFGIYLILTGSFDEYFYQSILYNQKYYIYNYPKPEGSTFINPLRFAVVIFNGFFTNFTNLLVQVKDFNLGFPLNITLALSNTVLLIYLACKRKYALLLFWLGGIVFGNARSNPLESKETDYQSAVYVTISYIGLSFILQSLYTELQEALSFSKKVIFTSLFLLLGVYVFFFSIFISKRFFYRYYEKYMGIAPKIYDQPELAKIMNTVVSNNEYTWIGPYEYEEMLYINGKIATKYHVFLPGMGNSPQIREDFIHELQMNKPKALWFNKTFSILGTSPNQYGQFLTKFIDAEYLPLSEYLDTNLHYFILTPRIHNVSVADSLYIRKDAIDEIVLKLIDGGILQEKLF